MGRLGKLGRAYLVVSGAWMVAIQAMVAMTAHIGCYCEPSSMTQYDRCLTGMCCCLGCLGLALGAVGLFVWSAGLPTLWKDKGVYAVRTLLPPLGGLVFVAIGLFSAISMPPEDYTPSAAETRYWFASKVAFDCVLFALACWMMRRLRAVDQCAPHKVRVVQEEEIA